MFLFFLQHAKENAHGPCKRGVLDSADQLFMLELYSLILVLIGSLVDGSIHRRSSAVQIDLRGGLLLFLGMSACDDLQPIVTSSGTTAGDSDGIARNTYLLFSMVN